MNTFKISSQLDGLSDSTGVTSKSLPNRRLRKRHLSTSSERETITSEEQNLSLKIQLNKSNSDLTHSIHNGTSKKCSGSLNNDHSASSKRRLSENNLEINNATNNHHSNLLTKKIQKPKVIQAPIQSNINNGICSSSDSISEKFASSNKPIREAKRRSLIYTGNTREFLQAAIANGIIDDNGEQEEDEDNEYVPPGSTVDVHLQCLSSSENDNESTETSDDTTSSSNDDDNDEDRKMTDDERIESEEPSESGINWNVRNRPQRQTHFIRFDHISQRDRKK